MTSRATLGPVSGASPPAAGDVSKTGAEASSGSEDDSPVCSVGGVTPEAGGETNSAAAGAPLAVGSTDRRSGSGRPAATDSTSSSGTGAGAGAGAEGS